MKRWHLVLVALLLLGCLAGLLAYGYGLHRDTIQVGLFPDTIPATSVTTLSTTVATEATTTATTEAPTEATTVPTEPPEPEADIHTLAAKHAFVYDLTADQLLYTHGDQNEPIAPASLTKLLTIIVAMEYLEPDALVTAGEEVYWIHPHSSVARVYKGNELTVEMLVQGMMMQSGNDAAYVLAAAAGRIIAGAEEPTTRQAVDFFQDRVNRRAIELGLADTNFVTPDGLDAKGHHTTAADLLLISKYALQIPLVRQYAACQQAEVFFASGQERQWVNTNWMLDPTSKHYCEDVIGLKTGSTSIAGNCLLGLFQDGDRELLICVLGCPTIANRFQDALALYDLYRRS